MMNQGHSIGEIVSAILVIVWGIIRYATIAVIIIGGLWLVMHSILIIVTLALLLAISNAKIKW
ncbi:hypothetical protein SAMN05216262_10299 [Colwellia chukchiensis]|uniref:Uncharacterized protein n=1 Tax=Colwellia chukchiensis TaxID=641665 RepID=A0A1H7J279_9GAMM|nr:hypothetical protein [Colwellia chukchiensis]SEK67957.1 hypothetical protein SAMN05216262_10299 [Colwellia chukchiensis]